MASGSVRNGPAFLQLLARTHCWRLRGCPRHLARDPRGVDLSNAGLFRPQASRKSSYLPHCDSRSSLAPNHHPEWIKWALRNITYVIETAADAIPYPWGDRIEIALRELGGFVWFQITLAIVSLRIALSIIAAAWRHIHKQ